MRAVAHESNNNTSGRPRSMPWAIHRPAMLVTLLLATIPALPATPKKPVTDTYFGTTVADSYRWLEDWNDPEVKKWSDAQNAHARGVLDALPGRAVLEKRLSQLVGFESPVRYP